MGRVTVTSFTAEAAYIDLQLQSGCRKLHGGKVLLGELEVLEGGCCLQKAMFTMSAVVQVCPMRHGHPHWESDLMQISSQAWEPEADQWGI